MSFADTVFQWLPRLRRPDGGLADGRCDARGNLKVVVASSGDAATTWVDPESGAPLTHRRTVASTAGRRLYAVLATNEGTEKRWLMVFDLAADPIPSAQPALARPLAPGEFYRLELARPRTFQTGITWAASTTPGVYTEDAQALFRVHVELE